MSLCSSCLLCNTIAYCEYLLHTFTTKVCIHIKPGWKWNYYVVVV
jgi:hypothetical protein